MNALQWLVLAALGLGASLLMGSTIALGVAGGLATAVVFSLLTSRAVPRNLVVRRRTDARLIEVGGVVTTHVQIQASGGVSLRWLLVRESLPNGITVDAPTGRLAVGWSDVATEFIYRARFAYRGAYQLGPVVAQHGDLLGLRLGSEAAEGIDEVIVHPRVHFVSTFHLASARPLGDRRADRHAHEDPTRPAGCRPYAQGDPIKRIHWAATARAGTLVSKVYDASSAPIYVVVLNRCAADYTLPERFELACTAAASLVAAYVREDDDIGMLTETMLKPDTGELHKDRALEALARAEMTDETLSEVLLRARLDFPWRATLIVVTETLGPSAGAALDMLRQRGFTLAAVVIGDGIETQRAVSTLAAMNGSVARIEKEDDLGILRFVGAAR